MCLMTAISIPLFITLEGPYYESQTDDSYILITGGTTNSTTGEPNKYLMAYDLKGNVLSSHQFNMGYIGFVDSIITYENKTLVVGRDMMTQYSSKITAYDNDGEQLWSNSIIKNPWIKFDIVIIQHDKIILVGTSGKSIPSNYFIIAYDINNGKKLWSDQFGKTNVNNFTFTTVYDDKIIIVYKSVSPSRPFGGGGDILYASIVTYDFNGEQIQNQEINRKIHASISSVAGYEDKIIITWNAENMSDFITIHDSNGILLWDDKFSGENNTNKFYNFSTTIHDDKLVLAGSMYSESKYARQPDGYVIVYDINTGRQLWSDQFEWDYIDILQSVTTYDDKIVLAGTISGSVLGHTSSGYFDIYIIVYDIDTGKQLWSDQFDGDEYYENRFFITTYDDKIILADRTYSPLPGYTLSGDNDIYIIAYDINTGKQLWSDQFGGEDYDYIINMKIISK